MTNEQEKQDTQAGGQSEELISNALLAKDELLALRVKIKKFCINFDKTRWGWDGDCGTQSLVDELEEEVQDQFGNWIC